MLNDFPSEDESLVRFVQSSFLAKKNELNQALHPISDTGSSSDSPDFGYPGMGSMGGMGGPPGGGLGMGGMGGRSMQLSLIAPADPSLAWARALLKMKSDDIFPIIDGVLHRSIDFPTSSVTDQVINALETCFQLDQQSAKSAVVTSIRERAIPVINSMGESFHPNLEVAKKLFEDRAIPPRDWMEIAIETSNSSVFQRENFTLPIESVRENAIGLLSDPQSPEWAAFGMLTLAAASKQQSLEGHRTKFAAHVISRWLPTTLWDIATALQSEPGVRNESDPANRQTTWMKCFQDPSSVWHEALASGTYSPNDGPGNAGMGLGYGGLGGMATEISDARLFAFPKLESSSVAPITVTQLLAAVDFLLTQLSVADILEPIQGGDEAIAEAASWMLARKFCWNTNSILEDSAHRERVVTELKNKPDQLAYVAEALDHNTEISELPGFRDSFLAAKKQLEAISDLE